MCKFLNSYEKSLHLGVCKLAKYVTNCVVFWKIYTADKNFKSVAGYIRVILGILDIISFFGVSFFSNIYCGL